LPYQVQKSRLIETNRPNLADCPAGSPFFMTVSAMKSAEDKMIRLVLTFPRAAAFDPTHFDGTSVFPAFRSGKSIPAQSQCAVEWASAQR